MAITNKEHQARVARRVEQGTDSLAHTLTRNTGLPQIKPSTVKRKLKVPYNAFHQQ